VEKKQLNPRIRYTDIGIREVRKIKLYPLSVHDQMELSDLVTEAVLTFFSNEEGKEEKSDAETLSFAIETVKANLGRILEIITDPEEKVSLKEIDNTQLSVIVTDIVDANYTNNTLSKNAKSLFEKIQSLFPSKRLPSMFAENIQGTGLNTFSGEATGKEA
jgi:hypothetical protein